MINGDLCKKLKFDQTTKWYMNKLESVPGNKTNKIIWEFDKQTNHLIPARRLNLELINKKI